MAGPTFALPELAGRKVVALFDRAEARDFTDVYALARRYSTSDLLEQARLVDRGFDEEVFAQMLGTLSRFTDQDPPIRSKDVEQVRAPVDDDTFDDLGPGLLTGLETLCPVCGTAYRVTSALILAEEYGPGYRRLAFDWIRC